MLTLYTSRPLAEPAGTRLRAEPALLGLCVVAALILLGDKMLADADTHWHVAIGGQIWHDRAVPWTDVHSHTFAGDPWIAKEWLSQLLLAGAFAAAGWSGLVLITAATIGLTTAILFGWLARRLRASFALAATMLAICLLAPHFLARPLVFGMLALVAWTTALVSAVERERTPPIASLIVLVLWANLHGSFTIAYPIVAVLAVEAVLDAAPGLRVSTALRWAGFGAGALLAGLATPYGIQAALVTAALAGGGEALPFLNEWRLLEFDAAGVLAIASAAALTVGLLIASPRNVPRAIAVAALAALSVRHSRFLDVYGLVAPILAAGPLAKRWAELRPEATETPTGRRPAWVGVALAIAAAAAVMLTGLLRPVPSPAVTPAAALAVARGAGLTGPVYNDYDYGGFLIAEGIPTFIDGRSDQLFLGGFISAVFAAREASGPETLLALLDRHRVSWALVKTVSSEARFLASAPGWHLVHRDAEAAVFSRDRPIR